MLLFLKLYLAHLIADFVLQPSTSGNNKRKLWRLTLHSLIYFAAAAAIINVFLTKQIIVALLVLAILHAASAYIRARLTTDGWFAFALDQTVHLAFIIGASVWLSTDPTANTRKIFQFLAESKKLYLYLCMYVGVTVGGGYLVQKVTQGFMRHIDPNLLEEKPGLPSAGKYIGWLERALVLTFFVAGYPDGVGLLLAAKALARYPEIKTDPKGHFAEYFLIGTLTSVSLALAAGFALLRLRALIGP